MWKKNRGLSKNNLMSVINPKNSHVFKNLIPEKYSMNNSVRNQTMFTIDNENKSEIKGIYNYNKIDLQIKRDIENFKLDTLKSTQTQENYKIYPNSICCKRSLSIKKLINNVIKFNSKRDEKIEKLNFLAQKIPNKNGLVICYQNFIILIDDIELYNKDQNVKIEEVEEGKIDFFDVGYSNFTNSSDFPYQIVISVDNILFFYYFGIGTEILRDDNNIEKNERVDLIKVSPYGDVFVSNKGKINILTKPSPFSFSSIKKILLLPFTGNIKDYEKKIKKKARQSTNPIFGQMVTKIKTIVNKNLIINKSQIEIDETKNIIYFFVDTKLERLILSSKYYQRIYVYGLGNKGTDFVFRSVIELWKLKKQIEVFVKTHNYIDFFDFKYQLIQSISVVKIFDSKKVDLCIVFEKGFRVFIGFEKIIKERTGYINESLFESEERPTMEYLIKFLKFPINNLPYIMDNLKFSFLNNEKQVENVKINYQLINGLFCLFENYNLDNKEEENYNFILQRKSLKAVDFYQVGNLKEKIFYIPLKKSENIRKLWFLNDYEFVDKNKFNLISYDKKIPFKFQENNPKGFVNSNYLFQQLYFKQEKILVISNENIHLFFLLRPIDKLSMILKYFEENKILDSIFKKEENIIDIFYEFIEEYGLKEVLCMLIQIYSENNFEFLFYESYYKNIDNTNSVNDFKRIIHNPLTDNPKYEIQKIKNYPEIIIKLKNLIFSFKEIFIQFTDTRRISNFNIMETSLLYESCYIYLSRILL